MEAPEFKFIHEMTVELIQSMGNDNMIAHAAWVSTKGDLSKKIEEPDKIPGLINYLMKSKHGSPFEHCTLTMFVHAPIFVWREWHRHRISSFSEESARYKTLNPVFYVPSSTRPMFKSENWKAGRPKFLRMDDNSFNKEEMLSNSSKYDRLCKNLINSYEVGYKSYLENLSMNFDPGLARDCLPVGTYSSCYVTTNVRSLMNFLSLRVYSEESLNKSYPLYEIDVAAQKVETIFKENWPSVHAAFVKNGRVAP